MVATADQKFSEYQVIFKLPKPLCLAAAAISIFNASNAHAADYWSGFYVGATAGYAWGNPSARTSSDCPGDGITRQGYFCDAAFPALAPNAAAVAAAGSGSVGYSSFVGGIEAGYNRQQGNWVVGAEADFSAFNISGSRASARTLYPAFGAGTSFVENSSIEGNWLMTVRARAGWTVSNALLFVTGGLAVAEVKAANSFFDNASIVVGTSGSGSGSSRDVYAGYVVGAGAEWGVTRNWSVKGEYLFVGINDVKSTARVTNAFFGTAANLVTTSTDVTSQIVRLGANYRF